MCRDAVHESYVTVAIVSDNFIDSSWCKYELEKAVEANVPIIPIYIAGRNANMLNGILKDVLERSEPTIWPEKCEACDEIFDDEMTLIKTLAERIA